MINLYHENTPTVPITYDVEVVGLKPHTLNDMLHIFKELKYLLLLVTNVEA
jgi:hypothetical protein